MSTFVRERELTELRDQLDDVVTVLDGACECDPEELPYDDLHWALTIVNKAVGFVQQSLE
jgi:hypothetical protein